jgi:hypothetical protein
VSGGGEVWGCGCAVVGEGPRCEGGIRGGVGKRRKGRGRGVYEFGIEYGTAYLLLGDVEDGARQDLCEVIDGLCGG